MKKILSLLAVLTLATACIYPYQPDLEDAPEGILVVDGNLMVGEKSQVRIGFMSSLWPKPGQSQSGELVYYTRAAGTGSVRVWAEDDGGGVYEGALDMAASSAANPNTPFSIDLENAPDDRSYRVCVQAGNDRYSSDWIKPLAPPVIKNVTFGIPKLTTGKTDVTVSASLDGGPDATGYLLLTYEETWRFHAEYYPNYIYIPASNSVTERVYPAWDRYWCWKISDKGTQVPVDYTGMTSASLKSFPFHSFSRYDNRNHQRYSILLTARTIDKDTYMYLNHLEESTESGDNLFSPNPGEVSGNLRCENDPERMVMGYVTVARTTSVRTYLDSRYLLTRQPNLYDLAYPPQWPKISGGAWWGEFYEMGYMPLVENTLPPSDADFGPYGWGPLTCYDCIAAGGTQTRPDFWEE